MSEHEWKKGQIGFWCEKCGYQKSRLVDISGTLDNVDCHKLARGTNSHDWGFHKEYHSSGRSGGGHISGHIRPPGKGFVYTNCWVCKRCRFMSPWVEGPPFAEVSCSATLMQEALE